MSGKGGGGWAEGRGGAGEGGRGGRGGQGRAGGFERVCCKAGTSLGMGG